MKPFKALLLTSLVLGACEKSNDITQLHEEAVAIAKYYGPRVDDMMKRRDAIYQRGRNVPGNLPDVPEIVKMISEAGEKLTEMHGIASPDNGGKSALEKQAEQLQKDGKLDELRKLIDESQDKLDEDWTIANDDLTKVEGWLWQYEQGHMNAAPPAVAPPQPTPNNAGEPPPAAAPANGDEKKAAEPKAGAGSTAAKSPDNKAAEKAAGEKADKKAAAPKADKAAAPKAGAGSAAAPKAGAGSAAK
jgi:hypothetical protein